MMLSFKFGLLVLFLLGVGGWLAFFGWSHATELRQLARDGVLAEARVIDHATSQQSRRSSSYELTVAFTPAGRAPVTNSVCVDGAGYQSAVKSRRIQVRYLSGRPEVCAASAVAVLPFQFVGTLGGGMFLLGLLLVWRAPVYSASETKSPG
jgi:hypothetical protein